jgi:hypothetical protein
MSMDLNFCVEMFTGCAYYGVLAWSMLGIIVYWIADLGG